MPAHPITPRPTDAELEILSVLWRLGSSTVREVHDVLSKERAIQYTTTLKLMQIMAEKGLLERDESARSHVYSARQPRERTQSQLAGHLLERAFGGSARNLLMGALSAKKASREELAELRKLLDEYETGRKS
ncbi:MAG: BlaI/MecI/CopY family transcriptional regulator [Bryobacterales bacterium]|nr:BlaI/MecI/CopY family transcriptional regulator [Bryobacterales bacterium]